MEMCLGDQQFATLMLYLEDICIFTANVYEMLDPIEMVFKRLKDFNVKIKKKKCHFFQHSVVFPGYVLSVDSISANHEKVEAEFHQAQKNFIHFWTWPHTICT